MVLGPCTISAKWPAKMAKNNKLYRNVEASDGTGSIKITLWGDAANLPFYDGMTASIRGSLKRGDYNGTPQLSGEQGLSLEPAAGGQPSLPMQGAAPQGAPAGQQAPSGGATNYYSKDQQIMRQNALTHATALVVAQGVSGSVFDAQRTVLELAVFYAKFSETGDTSIPELPSGEPGADGEPY